MVKFSNQKLILLLSAGIPMNCSRSSCPVPLYSSYHIAIIQAASLPLQNPRVEIALLELDHGAFVDGYKFVPTLKFLAASSILA